MANNIDVKDASGVTRTVKTTETGSINVPHHNVDAIASALPAGENIVGATRTAVAVSFATGKATIAATATQIVAARAERKGLLIVQEGTTLVRIGASGVTVSGATNGRAAARRSIRVAALRHRSRSVRHRRGRDPGRDVRGAVLMTNSLRIHPSVATLAFESAYDVYDDFSGAALGPLNGRMPKIGPYSWSATGAGVAGAFAGAGSMGSSVTGSTYAVMQLPATPWEVGGVFESLTGTFSPTIAIIKDYANHGFSVMWHAKLNVASHLFTPGYWNDTWNGAGSTQVNVAAAWLTPANVANYTLAANTKYRYRLFFNAPYVDYVIETMAGLPIVNYRTYDSIVSSIIGPWVFFEVAGADTVWHEAYTRSKPVLNSARMVRAYGGLEGTHIGMNNPAPANVQSLQVGLASSTPVGVFSVSYAGVDADAPSIANTTSHGAFKIKAGTNGFAAELQVINGGGGVAKYQLDGSYNTSLIGNSGSAFLTKPANAGTPYFAAGVKVNGSGGVTQTDAASIPTSGSYTIGDFVWNKSPVVASGKVLLGWSRLTTGSAHVSGTDWSPVYGTVS